MRPGTSILIGTAIIGAAAVTGLTVRGQTGEPASAAAGPSTPAVKAALRDATLDIDELSRMELADLYRMLQDLGPGADAAFRGELLEALLADGRCLEDEHGRSILLALAGLVESADPALCESALERLAAGDDAVGLAALGKLAGRHWNDPRRALAKYETMIERIDARRAQGDTEFGALVEQHAYRMAAAMHGKIGQRDHAIALRDRALACSHMLMSDEQRAELVAWSAADASASGRDDALARYDELFAEHGDWVSDPAQAIPQRIDRMEASGLPMWPDRETELDLWADPVRIDVLGDLWGNPELRGGAQWFVVGSTLAESLVVANRRMEALDVLVQLDQQLAAALEEGWATYDTPAELRSRQAATLYALAGVALDLGDLATARATYERLIDEHANHQYAALAQQHLEDLHAPI